MDRERGRTHRIVLAMGGTVVALALAEAALTLLDLPRAPPKLLRPTPDGSFRLRAGLDVHVPGPAGAVHVTTGPDGLRATGTRRDGPLVAFLGDSYTFGAWARDDASTFVGLVAATSDADVRNFGVLGFGYDEMEAVLREDIAPLRPAAIVLVTYAGNDLLDTWLGPRRYAVVPEGLRERPAVVAARFPGRERTAAGALLRLDRLRLARFLRAAFVPTPPRRAPIPAPDNPGADTVWSLREPPPWVVAAREHGAARLGALLRLASAVAPTLLVAMPYPAQVERLDAMPPELDPEEPQTLFRAVADAERVAYLDLRPALLERASEGLYLPGDGHLGDAGHAAVAALVAPVIARLLAEPP